MTTLTQTQTALFANAKNGLVKINTDSNVRGRLREGDTYYMYLPDTDEFLHLLCSFVAIKAADMKILKHIKGGNSITVDLDCTFGYRFEKYDSVNFASFNYLEPCELYVYQPVYVIEKPLESLFLEEVQT
jgi:hypothetical protein